MHCDDRVTLVALPAEVERDRERFPETYALCLKAVGQEFTVRGFNDDGMAELWIKPDGRNSEDACADSVWIEPAYLSETTQGGDESKKSTLDLPRSRPDGAENHDVV